MLIYMSASVLMNSPNVSDLKMPKWASSMIFDNSIETDLNKLLFCDSSLETSILIRCAIQFTDVCILLHV